MRFLAMICVLAGLVGCSGMKGAVGELGQNLWADELVAQGRADFPGVEPEGPGTWEVGGWEVKADLAWVERRGGKVVRLYAEGLMMATRGGTTLRGNWISVGDGGVPVVAECSHVVAEGRQYRPSDGVLQFEYRGEGKMRFLGAVVTGSGWGGS